MKDNNFGKTIDDYQRKRSEYGSVLLKKTETAGELIIEPVKWDHTHQIDSEYIRRHEAGDGISSRCFKQVMLISEVNGRISELRGKGYVIDTSAAEDRYGFKYHRLVAVPAANQRPSR
jgi:hypothetical protein